MSKHYISSFTKEEIIDIYDKIVTGKITKARYEQALTLETAVLANYKNLFPCFGYGYHYEDIEDDIVVPIALNAIIGDKFSNQEDNCLLTINRTNVIKTGERVIEVEMFMDDEIKEIPIEQFAELFDNVEFSENNIEKLK